jgi:hypothetical protein
MGTGSIGQPNLSGRKHSIGLGYNLVGVNNLIINQELNPDNALGIN